MELPLIPTKVTGNNPVLFFGLHLAVFQLFSCQYTKSPIACLFLPT